MGSSRFGGAGLIAGRISLTRGFTLIELLIVVAIIAILAAIAVPNFLEAQTRSKVSRVKADARSLATAVEVYRVDNNRYPERQKYQPGSLLGFGDVNTRLEDMRLFTTPVAYISSLPVDVFERNIPGPRNVLDYYSPELVRHIVRSFNPQRDTLEFGWLILSVGPDGLLGQTGSQGNYPVRAQSMTFRNEYDPTNGTISAGNITRFQKGGAVADDAFIPN